MQVSLPFALFVNWLLFNLFLLCIGDTLVLSRQFAFCSCLVSLDLGSFLGSCFLFSVAFHLFSFDDRVAILIDQSLILQSLELSLSFRFGNGFSFQTLLLLDVLGRPDFLQIARCLVPCKQGTDEDNGLLLSVTLVRSGFVHGIES